jgi:hypothetical protein
MCIPRCRPIPRDENLIPLEENGFELSVPSDGQCQSRNGNSPLCNPAGRRWYFVSEDWRDGARLWQAVCWLRERLMDHVDEKK